MGGGQPVRPARPAFLQGLLPAGPSVAEPGQTWVSATARRPIPWLALARAPRLCARVCPSLCRPYLRLSDFPVPGSSPTAMRRSLELH